MDVLDRLRLDGKVAVVTGAGRGLGRAMALALAEAGADLVVVARTPSQIEETAEMVRTRGRRCLAIPADITDPQAVQGMVDAVLAEYGRIDILVNNAGAGSIGRGKPIDELTDAEWRLGLDTNLSGAFYCCRAVVPHMVRQGGGKIINITSISGLRGSPNSFVYSAAKAGLINFSRSLAISYARHNIQCNLIAPGFFPHGNAEAIEQLHGGRYVPMGRVGEDEELGPLCVFLASDLSAHMSGQVIALDGGGMAAGLAPTGFAPVVLLEREARTGGA